MHDWCVTILRHSTYSMIDGRGILLTPDTWRTLECPGLRGRTAWLDCFDIRQREKSVCDHSVHCCGPDARKSALAPIWEHRVRFNSTEPTTLSMLIHYPRWLHVCSRRNVQRTVTTECRTVLLGIVFCRLIMRDVHVIKITMWGFCEKIFSLHVMSNWNL